MNASLIANKVIDYWQKRGVKGVACKLDIAKAFDNINWQFLMKIMYHMSFGFRDLPWTKITFGRRWLLLNMSWRAQGDLGHYRVGLWKEILREINWVKIMGMVLESGFGLITGVARQLSIFPPVLFEMANNKLAIVADAWDPFTSNGS